jgi:hypothetical protein
MNEKREAYIRVAVAMCKAGREDLFATKGHSDYFLRGIIDYSAEGKKANLNMKYAPSTYPYSVKASKLKNVASAYQNRSKGPKNEKLHAEHVIPNIMIFERLVHLAETGVPDNELADFLRESCQVVIITKEERTILDSEHGLTKSMPEGWEWGDDPKIRLNVAGIELES